MWPLELQSLAAMLNSTVSVTISDAGDVKQGRCIAIDPVTNSVILCREDVDEVTIINGINITDVTVLSRADNQQQRINPLLIKKGSDVISDEELQQRKQETTDWLQKHRISVKELPDGRLEVLNGQVSIRPPYEFSDCYCSNEVILSKIRSVLQSKAKINVKV